MVRTQGGTPTAVDLGRWTVGFYLGQHERYGIDSDFRALGYLIVATSEDDVRAAQLRLAMQRERGLDARWVTPAQAAELLPLLDPAAHPGRDVLRAGRRHQPAAQRGRLPGDDARARRAAARARAGGAGCACRAGA